MLHKIKYHVIKYNYSKIAELLCCDCFGQRRFHSADCYIVNFTKIQINLVVFVNFANMYKLPLNFSRRRVLYLPTGQLPAKAYN